MHLNSKFPCFSQIWRAFSWPPKPLVTIQIFFCYFFLFFFLKFSSSNREAQHKILANKATDTWRMNVVGLPSNSTQKNETKPTNHYECTLANEFVCVLTVCCWEVFLWKCCGVVKTTTTTVFLNGVIFIFNFDLTRKNGFRRTATSN